MKTYKEIQSTHELYCKLSGLDVAWHMDRLWPWEKWSTRFTDNDLRIVVRFIKDNHRMGKPARSLTFRNFISGPQSLEFFEEDLAEARARSRATRVDTDRASVLRATGRPELPETPVRTAEDVLRGNEALKQFLKLKESL